MRGHCRHGATTAGRSCSREEEVTVPQLSFTSGWYSSVETRSSSMILKMWKHSSICNNYHPTSTQVTLKDTGAPIPVWHKHHMDNIRFSITSGRTCTIC